MSQDERDDERDDLCDDCKQEICECVRCVACAAVLDKPHKENDRCECCGGNFWCCVDQCTGCGRCQQDCCDCENDDPEENEDDE